MAEMGHQLENQWTRNSVLLMGLYYALAKNIHTCNLLFPWNILWRDIVIIDPFWFLLEQNSQVFRSIGLTEMSDWEHENSKWRNETIAPLDWRSMANFSFNLPSCFLNGSFYLFFFFFVCTNYKRRN